MRKNTYDETAEQIGKAIFYGATQLDRPVRSAEVSAHVGYSLHHFQRLFHAMAGEPWAEFHRRLRLEQAAVMICEGMQAGEVSRRCGFDNQETFIRAFRSAYGCTPTAIRSQQASPPLLPTSNGVHSFDHASFERFRTLHREGDLMPFEIKEVARMDLIGIVYQGPIQFISNAWMNLHEWARSRGIDLNERLLVTFAEELDEDSPPEIQKAYVAIDDRGEEGLEKYSVGEGEFLVARHIGSGHLLSDFWLRVYGECIPKSGRFLRSVSPFQIYSQGLFVENPDDFVTDIYIPVESN
jgi:AraC family transcriptional regulator